LKKIKKNLVLYAPIIQNEDGGERGEIRTRPSDSSWPIRGVFGVVNWAEIIELESYQLLVKKMASSSEDAITQWFLG